MSKKRSLSTKKAKHYKKIIWFILIVILLVIVIQLLERHYQSRSALQSSDSSFRVYPQSAGEIITHTYYMLAYNEEAEQPYWVYYLLTREMIKGRNKRNDRFKSDDAVLTESATPQDYTRSGYDKGHLCPAADMKFSAQAMQETFLMSNMSPQKPQFNRGIWRQLETKVRDWVQELDSLWIVTGPICKDNMGTIGQNEVIVPRYFYKVIYTNKKGGHMIAFLLENEEQNAKLSHFVVTVDSIESLTQINFFPNIPNEAQLESHSNYIDWEK